METVEDQEGQRFLRLKRSAESSLVADPTTGRRCYLPNETLTPVERAGDELPLIDSIDPDVRRLVATVRTERTLGLMRLLELTDGLPAIAVLEQTDWCESELFATVQELEAAGLLRRTEIDGREGYELSDSGQRGLAPLITDESD